VSSPRHAWIATIAGILPVVPGALRTDAPYHCRGGVRLALDLFASFAVKHDR